MREPRAKELYSKIATYFLLFSTFFALGLSIFSKEIIMAISDVSFWSAYKIVPIVIINVILGGVIYIFQTGIYLTKKTRYFFFISTFSAIATLFFNKALIPQFNMYGAAMASVFCSVLSVFMTYNISQRLYPIKYELYRYAKLALVAVFIYLMTMFLNVENMAVIIFGKTCLLFSFPFILYFVKFFDSKEIEKITSIKNYLLGKGIKFGVSIRRVLMERGS
jgi:O-antigen/teichoic acid export membrane protein